MRDREGSLWLGMVMMMNIRHLCGGVGVVLDNFEYQVEHKQKIENIRMKSMGEVWGIIFLKEVRDRWSHRFRWMLERKEKRKRRQSN